MREAAAELRHDLAGSGTAADIEVGEEEVEGGSEFVSAGPCGDGFVCGGGAVDIESVGGEHGGDDLPDGGFVVHDEDAVPFGGWSGLVVDFGAGGGFRWGGGKPEGDGRACSGGAFDGELATVGPDDGTGERQAHAGPSGAGGEPWVDHAGQMICVDAMAFVAEGDEHPLFSVAVGVARGIRVVG